jgi:DNA-binding CsgD family transcriptional regulator
MGSLREADLRQVLDVAAECAAAPDLDAFRAACMDGLRRLIPGDAVGYNEVRPPPGESRSWMDPVDFIPADVTPHRLGELLNGHPVVEYVTGSGDVGVHTISDVATVNRFHGTEIYDELFGRLSVEDQISDSIVADDRLIIGIAINRDRPGFQARDRAVLEALHPHFLNGYRAALLASRGRVVLAALDAADVGVVLFAPSGAVEAVSRKARALLEHWLGRAYPLPEPLADWLSAGAQAPFTRHTREGELRVRRLPAAAGWSGDALVISERRIAARTDALASLGLPPRQRETIELAARGLDNDEIAREMFVSRRTVEKHLERAYRRLGVRNRAEAVSLVLGGRDGHAS